MKELAGTDIVDRKLIEEEVELDEIEINLIEVTNRERKKFEHLEELALSISSKGLIHPIAVKRIKNSKGFQLLAGERRLRACRLLHLETIPARIYPYHLDSFEVKGIEMEENLKREDMTDAERLKGFANLHKYWTELYGKKTSTAPGATGHSARDTAKRLGISPQKVSQDLELARYIELIPELADLEDRKEIKKFVDEAKRQIATEEKVLRLKELTKDKTTEKIISHRADAYVVGDFFEKIKDYPDESFDFAEIDIDYPIESAYMQPGRNFDQLMKEYKPITKEEYPEFMQKTLNETYRVLRKGAWVVIWFGLEYANDLLKWAGKAGFVGPNWSTGKWYKGKEVHNTRIPKFALGRAMEYFYYLKKATGELVKPHSEVFECTPLYGANQKPHPYVKPIPLMKEILEVFVEPGRTILVPFAGSGNTLVAGFEHECNCVGFDLGEKYKPNYVLTVAERYKKERKGKK